MDVDDEFSKAGAQATPDTAAAASNTATTSAPQDIASTASDVSNSARLVITPNAETAGSELKQQPDTITFSPIGVAMSMATSDSASLVCQPNPMVQSFLPDAHGIFHYHRPGGIHRSIATMHQSIHDIGSLAENMAASAIARHHGMQTGLAEAHRRTLQQVSRQFAGGAANLSRMHQISMLQSQLQQAANVQRHVMHAARRQIINAARRSSALQNQILGSAQAGRSPKIQEIESGPATANRDGSAPGGGGDDDEQWISDPEKDGEANGGYDALAHDAYELVSRMQRRAMERRTAAGGVGKAHESAIFRNRRYRNTGSVQGAASTDRRAHGRGKRLANAYARYIADEAAARQTVISMGQGSPDAILDILRSGVSIDTKDDIGRTALHIACSCGNVDGVRLLIHMGADVNATDTIGNTPLTIAATSARSDVIVPLLEGGADPRVGQGMVSAMTMVRSRLRLLRGQIRSTRALERASPETLGDVLMQARERRKRSVAVARECVDIIRLLRIYTQRHIERESSSGSVLYDTFLHGNEAPKSILSNTAVSELDDLSAQLNSLGVSSERRAAGPSNAEPAAQPTATTASIAEKGKAPDVLEAAVQRVAKHVLSSTSDSAASVASDQGSKAQEAEIIQSQKDEDQIEALLEKFSHLLDSAGEAASRGDAPSERQTQ